MAVGSVLETFLAGVDPRAAPTVVALDEVIREAHPEFDVAIRYRMLMYTIGSDWHSWVCAISALTDAVGLRFLYGVILDDPKRVLRAGSSVLKTWDFGYDDPIDRATVGAYVEEAVSRYDEYKARKDEVLQASRAAAKPVRRATPAGG